MKRRNFLSTAATAGFATALFPNCNFMSNPKERIKNLVSAMVFTQVNIWRPVSSNGFFSKNQKLRYKWS